MVNAVTKINKEYFGKDKSRTYLKDDFNYVLRGIVQRSVLIDVLVEASKSFHNKKEHENGSISLGNFDPDNSIMIGNIFETYQKGWMLGVRQLLVAKEKGAGGKFIEDIQRLTTDNFINFYKRNKRDSTSIPPFLFVDFANASKLDKTLKANEFINSNRTKIDKSVNKLLAKARRFQNKKYFNKIIYKYQALEFHKDKKPRKYDVREELMDMPVIDTKHTIRSRKSKVEIQNIAKFLNDFAEIISLYNSLVGKNTSFLGSYEPLDTFIDNTFAVFTRKVTKKIKKKCKEDVVKYLHKAIDVVGWDHRKIIQETNKKA